MYFGLGSRNADTVSIGDVLPQLRKIATESSRKA